MRDLSLSFGSGVRSGAFLKVDTDSERDVVEYYLIAGI
jgi:hypothetical protein